MTPAQIARENLTDYAAQVVSRIITPMQATLILPKGTRLWRAELLNKTDWVEVNYSAWTTDIAEALTDADILLTEMENELEAAAEAVERAELKEVAS